MICVSGSCIHNVCGVRLRQQGLRNLRELLLARVQSRLSARLGLERLSVIAVLSRDVAHEPVLAIGRCHQHAHTGEHGGHIRSRGTSCPWAAHPA